MDDARIIGAFPCSNRASTWTEYLCMTELPVGFIRLASKSREVLCDDGSLEDHTVVWPDGYDPDDEDCDEQRWPVSIDGKLVVEFEDGIYLGEELEPIDGAAATFARGDWSEARRWILDHYESAYAVVDEATLAKIQLTFEGG